MMHSSVGSHHAATVGGTSHLTAKRVGLAAAPGTMLVDVENRGPNLQRAITLNAGADKENAPSALASSRATRSRTGLVSGVAATATAGTSGLLHMQHKPRRVLQDMTAQNAAAPSESLLPAAPLQDSTTTVSTLLSSSRRICSTLSTTSLLSATTSAATARSANGQSTNGYAAIPSLATLNATQRASSHTLHSSVPRSLSVTSSSLLPSAHGIYNKPLTHVPRSTHGTATAASISTSFSSSAVASVTSSTVSVPSVLSVPPSFLSGNFSSSALSTFCAQSHVSNLTAVQDKEREVEKERKARDAQHHHSYSQQQPTRESPCMMLTDGADESTEAAPLDSHTSFDSTSSAMDLCSSPMSALPVVPAALAFGSVPAHMPPSDAHLWGAELTSEIVDYWFESELKHHAAPDYLQHQSDLNSKMREILTDWLHEVVARFRLQAETMFLAVGLLDRFLSAKAVGRKKLQLVGCVALLLASKYEEIFIPEIKDFLTISDHAYEREHVMHMESIMLNTLNFQLTQVTPLRFMQRFMNTPEADFMIRARWATTENSRQIAAGTDSPASTAITSAAMLPPHLAQYLLELTLQFVRFLEYRPSTLAASVVYIVAHHVHVESGAHTPYVWSAGMERETRHTAADLHACVRDVYSHWLSLSETAAAAVTSGTAASGGPGNKCLAIYRKFGKRYSCVNQVHVHKPTDVHWEALQTGATRTA